METEIPSPSPENEIPPGPERKRRTRVVLRLLAAVVLFCLIGCLLASPAVYAQDSSEGAEGAITPPSLGNTADIYHTLEQSFQKTLNSEKQKLETFRKRFEKTGEIQEGLANSFSKYQTMLSTQTNMLLLPSVDLQTMVQAHTEQKVVLDNLKEQLEKFAEKVDEYKRIKEDTTEQIRFYEEQVSELRAQPPNLAVNQKLVAKLQSLIEVLSAKQEAVDGLIGFYKNWSERFKGLEVEIKALSRKYEESIANREKRRILNQGESPLVRIFRGELTANIGEMAEKTEFMLSNRFWSKPEEVSWENYTAFLSMFVFFLLVTEALLYLFTRFCGRMKSYCLDQANFWQFLTMKLFQRTFLIAGAIAFIYYFPVRPVYRLTPFFVLFPLLIRILFVLLAVQWGLVFIRSMKQHAEDRLFIRLIPLLRKLLIGIGLYGTGYFIIGRLYCEDCMTLIAWRMLFEIGLLVWMAVFLHLFRKHAPGSKLSGYGWFEHSRPLIAAAGYLLVLVGLLAELIGFGGFAAFWYLSLGRIAIVLLWSYILFGVLRESDAATVVEKSDTEDMEDPDAPQPYPVRWLVVRLLRLFLVLGVIFALPIAAGAERTFLADLFYAINYKLSFGDIELSVIGIIYAVIVLLVIHTLTVIWKSVLRNRILRDVKLESGLKDSITRITGYGLWSIGILIALRMIGISGTSLTVIFGAVGIGLGFGLQNIFNNFISGIILLFERPIQVGDVIEIDGMWGTVREINVRATHVKTYDNADLIIPNSDFISQRLTNWSFRDARVRRKIRVGVAYGSDIQLVKDTLINIAYKHPRVLRRPYPEILFADFGESALIFELRFWCHIDYFLDVETDIRFEIDSQFRENNIRIPFPQRDIHVKEAASGYRAGDGPVFAEDPPLSSG